MSAQPNFFKIGVFVLSGAALFLVGVLLLGARALFEQNTPVETYFAESVQGLDIGSQVKFRGVHIGNVEAIHVVNSVYDTDERHIRVVMALFPEMSGMQTARVVREEMPVEIAKGLRVRLAYQGVTGTAYLELNYLDPERNPPLAVAWQPHYPYLPSATSTITQFSDAASRILANLERIDAAGISLKVEEALTAMTAILKETNIAELQAEGRMLLAELRDTNREIGSMVAGARVDELSRQAEELIAELRSTNTSVKGMVDRAAPGLEELATTLPQAAAELRKLTANLNTVAERLPEDMAPLHGSLRRLEQLLVSEQQNIDETLSNLKQVTDNLREVSDALATSPSQVLFSKPPPRSKP